MSEKTGKTTFSKQDMRKRLNKICFSTKEKEGTKKYS